MKKYRIKEKFFGHQPGQTIVTDKNNQFILGTIDPSTYPHAFEEIKEPSDEEVLAEWIFKDMMGYQQKCFEPTLQLQKHGRRLEPDDFLGLAHNLIAKGFDVSKLREGK